MMRFKKYKKLDSFIVNCSSRMLSFFLLIILAPVFLIIYILIYLLDGKPIFYNSQRSGYLGKSFNLYKFRTMSENNLEENLRITKFGRFLRRSSLDELPQLMNILKGEMVFVGPRPLPYTILKAHKYKRFFLKRSSVKPGLTGLSQAFSKGIARDYSEKLVYDLLYINKKSILFDVIIILITFRALQRRFISNKTGATL